MDELIKITYENDKIAVSARELHDFLEVKTAYKDWFPRMCEYGFVEGEDFCSFLSESTGGRPSQDAIITIDMAKEICMLQRNEKGKEARQYFIQLEKDWNSPEKVMARALQIADQKIKALEAENAQQKQLLLEAEPKLNYVDQILKSKNAINITQIAKDYGMAGAKMNNLLHDLGIQYKQHGQWLLYSKYANQGYTKSKTGYYVDENEQAYSYIHTKWTQKGRLFLYEQLKSIGVLPLIEQ